MRRTICAAAALLMLLTVLPLCPAASSLGTRQISTQTVIDTDGSDGYSGDYVVVYNPSTGSNSRLSTGNMEGRIITEVEEHPAASVNDEEPYIIDVDAELAQKAKEAGIERPVPNRDSKGISFEVGDTNEFMVLNYSPLPDYYIEFKVLAKGEHCYIWTPTSTAANVWPLDTIDPSFAQTAADVFDSKFDLMVESFGEHSNGSDGDGRLNILYYNIDDGWQPGQGYVGGYFSAYDLYMNGMPILNIDTYPGVHYVSPQGEVTNDISRTFNTMVHEYQHLINYSECGYADTWINECMSAAAEEICFPGSSVYPRIQTWINHSYKENEDWDTPPHETEYNPAFTLQNGFSMYAWDNNIEIDDILVLYAQVSLFAQYIYTHHGNAFFRSLMGELADGSDFVNAYKRLTGRNAADFVADYRVALTANTTQDEYEGRFGFIMQQDFDPQAYHGIENLYELLCPVVFTGTSCSIAGGGAICIKPVGGVYYPPSGASGGLRYYGVTRTCAAASLEGIELAPADILLFIGQAAEISAIAVPSQAGGYTLDWQISDPTIAELAADGASAVVTGLTSGSAVVTVTAHDNVSGETYTAEANITVSDFLLGDVDGNGVVNANDSLLAMRAVLGLVTITPEQLARADIDGDGSVSANDSLWILRRSLGLV